MKQLRCNLCFVKICHISISMFPLFLEDNGSIFWVCWWNPWVWPFSSNESCWVALSCSAVGVSNFNRWSITCTFCLGRSQCNSFYFTQFYKKHLYLAFLVWPFLEAENLDDKVAFLNAAFHLETKLSFYGTNPEERLHHLNNYKLSRAGKIFAILSYEFHHSRELKIHGNKLFEPELILRTGRESGTKLLRR